MPTFPREHFDRQCGLARIENCRYHAVPPHLRAKVCPGRYLPCTHGSCAVASGSRKSTTLAIYYLSGFKIKSHALWLFYMARVGKFLDLKHRNSTENPLR